MTQGTPQFLVLGKRTSVCLKCGWHENGGSIRLDGPRVERIGVVSFDLLPHVHEEGCVQVAVRLVLSVVLCEVWADQNWMGGQPANVNLLVTEYLVRIAFQTPKPCTLWYLMISNSFGLEDRMAVAPRCTW